VVTSVTLVTAHHLVFLVRVTAHLASLALEALPGVGAHHCRGCLPNTKTGGVSRTVTLCADNHVLRFSLLIRGSALEAHTAELGPRIDPLDKMVAAP
jgi:hypothetical protein